MKKFNKAGGFTLIELLVVIGIIAILAAIVIVAINPAKRFADARQSQRAANIESILSALQQNMVDNNGILTGSGCDSIPSATSTIATGQIDLASCLADYLAILPLNPSTTTAKWENSGDYYTGYQIRKYGTNQIAVIAPAEGVDPQIMVIR